VTTFTLKNLTAKDLPPAWIKKFHPLSGQSITVHIILEEISEPTITQKISTQKERITLMREIEKQLTGMGDEDSEEWIKTIKKTHTFSEPKHTF